MTKTKSHGKINIGQNKNTILIKKLERKLLITRMITIMAFDEINITHKIKKNYKSEVTNMILGMKVVIGIIAK